MAFDDIVTNYNNEKTHFRLYDIKITSIDVRNLSIINNFDYRSAITKNSHIQGFESTLREYITSLSEKGIPFDTIEVTGVPHLTVKHNKIMEVMQKVLSGNYSYVTDKSRNDNTYASKRIENLRERYYNFYDCLGDLKIDDTDSLAYIDFEFKPSIKEESSGEEISPFKYLGLDEKTNIKKHLELVDIGRFIKELNANGYELSLLTPRIYNSTSVPLIGYKTYFEELMRQDENQFGDKRLVMNLDFRQKNNIR